MTNKNARNTETNKIFETPTMKGYLSRLMNEQLGIQSIHEIYRKKKQNIEYIAKHQKQQLYGERVSYKGPGQGTKTDSKAPGAPNAPPLPTDILSGPLSQAEPKAPKKSFKEWLQSIC